MKKAYIVRYGAIGDVVHCSHLPRLLKENANFDYITFETNTKGMPILMNNPFIDNLVYFEPSRPPLDEYPMSFIDKRIIEKSRGYDKVINLNNSIERAYLAMENMNEFFMPTEYRRSKYGGYNFYDWTTKWAGFEEYISPKYRGDLFFTQKDEDIVRSIYEREYKDKFVIVCNLAGSSKQKLFYNAESVIKEFLLRHKEAVCILMGDKKSKLFFEFEGERIIQRSMVYPIRQSMLMTKYAGMTIGYESGLMVASTWLGTPTIQLMTTSSIKNHGGDFSNDYSLQSPCYCSPCHKGPYEFIGCPKFEHLSVQYPKCIQFDPQVILNRMEEVYKLKRI